MHFTKTFIGSNAKKYIENCPDRIDTRQMRKLFLRRTALHRFRRELESGRPDLNNSQERIAGLMLRRLEAELRAAAIIHHNIWEKTSRNVQNLHVVQEGKKVILKGYCKTYYTKQLAQQIALELIHPDFEIKNEIQVANRT